MNSLSNHYAHRKRRLLAVPLAVLVTVVIVGGCLRLYQQHQYNVELMQNEMRTAISYQQNHYMPAKSYMENMRIEQGIQATGSISDTDLSTMLAMMDTSQSTDPALVHSRVLYTLHFLKTIPAHQSQKIYDATVPLLSGNPKQVATLDKTAAAIMMGTLKDKRAIPYLLPLLGDQDFNVRRDAQNALKAIGYSKAS